MQQYLNLLKEIKEKGCLKPAARKGMPGTKSLFGYQFRHNLSTGFPLLTTKKMNFKNIVIELLWFLRGDTNIKFLVDNDCNIWNEDAYNYYLKKHENIINNIPSNDPFSLLCNSPLPFKEFINFIKNNKAEDLKTFERFKPYSYGDCGYQYGKVWRKWELQTEETYHNDEKFSSGEYKWKSRYKSVDQITNLINSLKNNPESRRHIVTSIDPAHDKDLALYWCHALMQFNCRPLSYKERIRIYRENSYVNTSLNELNGEEYVTNLMNIDKIPKYYLDCQMYQRSADVVLGVPYNIASYALLTHILCKICNMIPGEFIHSFGDVHIYENHNDAVDEQLKRTPGILPTLKIRDEGNNWAIIPNFIDLINALDYNDFILENYNPQPRIKAELSTGLI